MRRVLAVVGLVAFIGFVYGCQPPAAPPDKDAHSTSGRPSVSPGSHELASDGTSSLPDPKQTVQAFLQALRAGDQEAATAMLTAKAQRETEAKKLAIKPPGSQTAEFTVTEMEIRGKNRNEAQVLSTWTDTDGRGTRQTYEIVWLLRSEPAGWAIRGMATRVFDDQQPLILDFENPEEMMRERQRAEREIVRRTQTQVSTQPASETVAEQPDRTRRE
jgi:hypothetical protein